MVGLLGLFGVGNLGNDGSLEVGLQMLEAVCITPAPSYIADSYGLRTIKMHQPRPLSA